MNNRFLRWLGIILALTIWCLILVGRVFIFDLDVTWASALVELLVIGLGAGLFWTWLIRRLESQEAEIQERTRYLEALHEASTSLTTELELETVLQKVTDLSRSLIDAEYGALGVLADDGKTIDQFITSGMSLETRARIGTPPVGRGLLGALVEEGRSIRITDLASEPRAIGFPPNHPHMHSFLGVPIRANHRVFGNLYLTNKIGADGQRHNPDGGVIYGTFTQHDQEILEMFAIQAAAAIENAQLYRQNERIAIMEERERFGMDLHDGVIQSIYAVGLHLDDSRHYVDQPDAMESRIANAIDGLNEVIIDIRGYIQDLRTQRFRGRDLAQGLEDVVRDVQANSLLNVRLHVDPVAVASVNQNQTEELLHIAKEAVTNIRKHAHATQIDVRLAKHNGRVCMTVEDNGAGFDMDHAQRGYGDGLRNMADRAEALHGDFHIEAAPGEGARISLAIPTS